MSHNIGRIKRKMIVCLLVVGGGGHVRSKEAIFELKMGLKGTINVHLFSSSI